MPLTWPWPLALADLHWTFPLNLPLAIGHYLPLVLAWSLGHVLNPWLGLLALDHYWPLAVALNWPFPKLGLGPRGLGPLLAFYPDCITSVLATGISWGRNVEHFDRDPGRPKAVPPEGTCWDNPSYVYALRVHQHCNKLFLRLNQLNRSESILIGGIGGFVRLVAFLVRLWLACHFPCHRS